MDNEMRKFWCDAATQREKEREKWENEGKKKKKKLFPCGFLRKVNKGKR